MLASKALIHDQCYRFNVDAHLSSHVMLCNTLTLTLTVTPDPNPNINPNSTPNYA